MTRGCRAAGEAAGRHGAGAAGAARRPSPALAPLAPIVAALVAVLVAGAPGLPLAATSVVWLPPGAAPRGVAARNPQGGVPAAPANLTAVAAGATSIQLAWTPPAAAGGAAATAVHIEASPLGGAFSEVASVPASASGSLVQDLAPASGYLFRVRASNAAGDSPYSNQATAATLGTVGPCLADTQTLCLAGGRFRVVVAWQTATGSGAGSVVPAGSPDSGLLWFFTPDDWELLLKVLNGCAIDNSYWVFLAAATNVGYEVSVTDSLSGQAKVYYHPLDGPAVSLTDTSALAVCP